MGERDFFFFHLNIFAQMEVTEDIQPKKIKK